MEFTIYKQYVLVSNNSDLLIRKMLAINKDERWAAIKKMNIN